MAEIPAQTPIIEALRDRLCRCWQNSERLPVEDLLRDYPDADSDPDGVLILVFQEYVLRQERGEQPQLAEYFARFPHLTARLERVVALDSWIVRSPSNELLDSEQATTPPNQRPHQEWVPPSDIPGYDIEEEIGRGGAGVVYKARQQGLERSVALKLLLAGVHASAEELRRFQTEAKAQAELQHPHVVQIHEVGETTGTGGGPPVHFLAMEYVDGGSLAQRLQGKPQPSRTAAELVATLARAMHVAHQHGLVHRDLKPLNILLAFREGPQPTATATPLQEMIPKIADFGLVKRLQPDGQASLSGHFVGTPSYMAPEQVDISRHLIGPATDVYGLGAILYEMLTGRPPFLGESWLGILHQVRTKEPVGVRWLNPEVPRDLENICLMCLRKEPAKRYATAADLAEDLRRFLAGEPVRARPIGPLGRLARWCRRKPTQAALAAALLLAVVGGFAGVTWQWLRADENKLLAQENYRQARNSLDKFLTLLNEEELFLEPDFRAFRKKGLETLLHDYQQFLKYRLDEPSLRAQTAKTHLAVGTALRSLGRAEEARAAIREAQALLRQLTSEIPTDRDFKASLALCSLQLCLASDSSQEAMAAIREAHDLFTQLHQDGPDDQGIQNGLAAAKLSLAAVWGEEGKKHEALQGLQEARTIWTRLVAARPNVPQYRRDLATTLGRMADLQYRISDGQVALRWALDSHAGFERLAILRPRFTQAQYDLARSHTRLASIQTTIGRSTYSPEQYERAHAIMARLAADHPDVTSFRVGLAEALTALASLQRIHGLLSEALRNFEQARAEWATLAALNPDFSPYREGLARSHDNVAAGHSSLGQLAPARDALHEAVALWKGLVTSSPGNPRYRNDLIASYGNLASIQQRTREFADAVKVMEEACRVGEELIRDHPDILEYEQNLGRSYSTLGFLQGENKQFKDAVLSFRAALAIQEKLAAHPSASPQIENALGETYHNFGVILARSRDVAEALRRFEQGRDIRQKLVAAQPQIVHYRYALAMSWHNVGMAMRDSERLPDALAAFQEAGQHLRLLCATTPKNAEPWTLLTINFQNLFNLQRKLGRPAELAASAAEVQSLWPENPKYLFVATCLLARCIPLVAPGKTELTADEQTERQKYGDLSLSALRQAIAHGFKDVERLQKDPELEPLRDRKDFHQLVSELQEKLKKEMK